MQLFIKLLRKLIFILLIFIGVLYFSGYGYLVDMGFTIIRTGRAGAGIDDYKYFYNRSIEKSSNPQPWAIHKDYNQTPPTKKLSQLHKDLGTVAYMIIKNDSIWHEQYFEGYGTSSFSNSFSMSKSVVCAMLGRAISEGFIKNITQKVGDYLPEFNDGYAAQLTVGDLASMSSGLQWTESYTNLLTITPRVYVEKELNALMRTIPIESEPGKSFRYLSGNTQLLAMVLEEATGKNVSTLLKEWFWEDMGAENEVLWQLDDENGNEKAYCCFNSNARDFARFGKLFKNNGVWNGKTLLDPEFIKLSITPRFEESPQYGYGWWLGEREGRKFYSMQGHLGQYVIVLPEENTIVVRLGHQKIGNLNGNPHPEDCYYYIEEALKMIANDSTS